jgi:hypothetical protein
MQCLFLSSLNCFFSSENPPPVGGPVEGEGHPISIK